MDGLPDFNVAADPNKSCGNVFIIKPEHLRKVAGRNAKDAVIVPVAKAMNELLPPAGLMRYLPLCHFVGQSAHETGGFRTLKEDGGPSYFARYNNRADLGNGPHDGPIFFGRGIFQCTGRFNYRKYGKRLGIDLEKHPELAADPVVSVQIAILYWQDRNMTALAERDDVFKVSAKINGINKRTGEPNGLEERETLTETAKKVFIELKAAA